MTEELAVATIRLATLTSVINTRRQDAFRFEVNAGLPRDLNARAQNAAIRLELAVEKLEKAIS